MQKYRPIKNIKIRYKSNKENVKDGFYYFWINKMDYNNIYSVKNSDFKEKIVYNLIIKP